MCIEAGGGRESRRGLRRYVSFGLFLVLGCAGPMENRSGGELTSTPGEFALCRQGSDLAHHDGQRVRLVGIYRKSLTAIKMRGERLFRGFVHIELEGRASDAVSTASGGPAIVELVGPRSDEEVERFTGSRVRVDGRLVLDPYRKTREEGVDHAAVIFGPPRLEESGELFLQPGS